MNMSSLYHTHILTSFENKFRLRPTLWQSYKDHVSAEKISILSQDRFDTHEDTHAHIHKHEDQSIDE